MPNIIARFSLFLIYLLVFSCTTLKNPSLQLIIQKKTTSKINGLDVKILREYYVTKPYKSISPTYSELDSLALHIGHTKGKNYDVFYVFFFSSPHKFKADSMLFKLNDSSLIVTKRKNLVNYVFKNAQFREKQIIKAGKILKPLFSDVDIKFDQAPTIKVYN